MLIALVNGTALSATVFFSQVIKQFMLPLVQLVSRIGFRSFGMETKCLTMEPFLSFLILRQTLSIGLQTHGGGRGDLLESQLVSRLQTTEENGSFGGRLYGGEGGGGLVL